MSFESFNLKPALLQAIQQAGYKTPSEVQQQAIPLVLQGKDVVAQSKTGTGKTAAFAIPIIQITDPKNRNIQSLILVPTRELAQQVTKEFDRLGRTSNIRSFSVYGGQSISAQINELRRGVNVLVATPGRMLDLLRRREVDVSHITVLVLDEADKMFEMGFKEDVEDILNNTPKDRQTMLFSATFSKEVRELSQNQLFEPIEINLSEDTLTVEDVQQYFSFVDPKRKISALSDLVKEHQMKKAIVFCRTQRMVDRLSEALYSRGISAKSMHGGMSQNMREKTLREFNQGKFHILVSTNLAARGLHIDNVTHIVNYDFPTEDESYVHRIGRTARQGKKGVAITFVTNMMEKQDLDRIAHRANTEIEEIQSKYR